MPINKMTDTERFLLDDLEENHSQSSWDWAADERFAEYLGINDTLISEAMDSCAPAPLRIAASGTWAHVTAKRLRLLRRLVSRGLVESYWVGTGPGGKYEFGLNRIRTYSRKDAP